MARNTRDLCSLIDCEPIDFDFCINRKPYQPKSKFAQYLKKKGACQQAIKFADRYENPDDAWRNCEFDHWRYDLIEYLFEDGLLEKSFFKALEKEFGITEKLLDKALFDVGYCFSEFLIEKLYFPQDQIDRFLKEQIEIID